MLLRYLLVDILMERTAREVETTEKRMEWETVSNKTNYVAWMLQYIQGGNLLW